DGCFLINGRPLKSINQIYNKKSSELKERRPKIDKKYQDKYISLLWDTGSCIPAFRFNLITLVSSLFLFCDNLVKVIIPAAFLIVYSLLIRFLGPVFFNGVSMQGDMILALFTSGTFFTAVYVLGWYGTTPSSIQGKLLYGIFAGISAFFICGGGTSPVGMAFTVLISNIFSIIIQQFENRYDRISLSKMLEENRKLQEDM
ncbi:MAG: RnfABCDGE type electron transport complex subunit D, partial [Treponema sp.]|nr:RnfABCDGE type electron transport complex subunit D [Treponema sp.]